MDSRLRLRILKQIPGILPVPGIAGSFPLFTRPPVDEPAKVSPAFGEDWLQHQPVEVGSFVGERLDGL